MLLVELLDDEAPASVLPLLDDVVPELEAEPEAEPEMDPDALTDALLSLGATVADDDVLFSAVAD